MNGTSNMFNDDDDISNRDDLDNDEIDDDNYMFEDDDDDFLYKELLKDSNNFMDSNDLYDLNKTMNETESDAFIQSFQIQMHNENHNLETDHLSYLTNNHGINSTLVNECKKQKKNDKNEQIKNEIIRHEKELHKRFILFNNILSNNPTKEVNDIFKEMEQQKQMIDVYTKQCLFMLIKLLKVDRYLIICSHFENNVGKVLEFKDKIFTKIINVCLENRKFKVSPYRKHIKKIPIKTNLYHMYNKIVVATNHEHKKTDKKLPFNDFCLLFKL